MYITSVSCVTTLQCYDVTYITYYVAIPLLGHQFNLYFTPLDVKDRDAICMFYLISRYYTVLILLTDVMLHCTDTVLF